MSKARSVADCIKLGNGRYAFGQSLYLVVRGGSALWEHQFRQSKKLRTMSFGSAIGTEPVTVMQARAMRAGAWLERRQRGRQSGPENKRFAEARDEYLRNHADEWGEPERVKASLENHAATLDSKRVRNITTDDVADLLRPIWKGPGSTTGARVRSLIEKILRAAGVEKNPATWAILADKLSNKVAKGAPRPSLPYADVPAFMRELAANHSTQARALRFIVLTGVRQDEALEATWREFDLVNRLWTIPADRMKMDEEHVVALSAEAIACLGSGGADDALVFPSRTRGRISQQTTRDLLSDLRPGVTVHGFRSSMAMWAREQGHFPPDVIDRALAHTEANKVRKVYQRSDLMVERKAMLEQWASFAAGSRGVLRSDGPLRTPILDTSRPFESAQNIERLRPRS